MSAHVFGGTVPVSRHLLEVSSNTFELIGLQHDQTTDPFTYLQPRTMLAWGVVLLAPLVFASTRNVSTCPGYTLHSLVETPSGLSAQLSLAGEACNAFGEDISALTVEVAYETTSRLRVNIFDTAKQQYTIPEAVIARPPVSGSPLASKSDLVFNYEPSPFAFWITRRSQPRAPPLFDTRISSLPAVPTGPVIPSDNSTLLTGFPLVFEKQYLQLTSALPLDTNIYGLGEAVASSGFRRNIGVNGGSMQTMWSRDAADPVDGNMYGTHPIYLEHRFDEATNESFSHGVHLMSAAGGDILLLTPQQSNVSLVQYRMIGGVLDFYFFAGPDPKSVVEQYGALVGLPTWQPAWGFGFHLCRWGYHDLNETRQQVLRMKEANIPLEVMWNDIDLYHAVRDFTTDPVTYPAEEVRAFIRELAANDQHYIPIVDAAIAKQVNATDIYDPYTKGAEQNVFMKNPDGSEYVGQVWPGYTVFPDWFAPNATQWWTEALRNWTESGVEVSGIWLDMNEPSSFCVGSCGTNANLTNTSPPFILPGEPGNPITDYPECYDSSSFGPSGNMTVNGTSTCRAETTTIKKRSEQALRKRGLGAGQETGVDLNAPPYAIHNGDGNLSFHTVATNATHFGKLVELDVHSLFGLMEEKATHLALLKIFPGKRPFLISRSTAASSGKWTGHWLGDNFSLWSYLRHSISGVLQFQLFQIPFVGADTCGFNGNTDEELCNRWMQMAAFTPFYRNHNIKGAISQEPYRWDSVANASRTAIAIRYSLLPYWYTLFANSSMHGTPPMRALFFEFPDEPELYNVSTQFMIGRDILVTPVLTPNVTTVDGIFPGRGRVIWRDWYTHDVVNAATNGTTTLPAPLGHINVHVRDGSAILLHAEPAYTIEKTRQGPFSLLVSQSADGRAFGSAYIDDGVSYPPGPSRTLKFIVTKGRLHIQGEGSFHVHQQLTDITVLAVAAKPSVVSLDGKEIEGWQYMASQKKLVVQKLQADLNGPVTLEWK
ncbi:putative glycosyl hydrolase 31 family protein [Lyophyllum shimeji]|uniref:Glycosyl hydrolase 31 family protein n=1 Tax=Lyophyllum shimeji TaxID=47721 RepID=A0A9P3PSS0_LYOSH|nr:putative glycosyl hydrolase 31 family protein [Lyophyllum shimeji]